MNPIDIILIAVMATQNPFTKQFEIYYDPLDYYKTIGECNKEKARLTAKNKSSVRYLCLTIDRN